ncbi:hypothetical protein AWENTII_003957 [Aspergillus wentii]
MEHVSTLCAISTVGIAATGFALGRVDQTTSKSGIFRRKTLPLHDQCASARSTPEPALSSVPPRSSRPATIKETESFSTNKPHGANENGAPAGSRPEDPNSRRGSSFAAVRLRRRGQTLTSPPPRASEDQSHISHARRPSSSWLRRLSIVSFQTEGRFSPSPVSPSFNVPASPDTSRPSSQRRTPNKLVKRSSSQHSNAHPVSPSTPSSSTFRRPATSYQRSETLRHRATHSLNFEPGFGVGSSRVQSTLFETPPELAKHDGDWRPYLNSRSDRLPEKLARRLSTAGRPKDHGLRKILPSADAVPALLLGTSISNKEPATDVEFDVSAPSTPATPLIPASPVQFRDPFKPVDTPALRPETPFPPEKTSNQPSVFTGEADPKQSGMNSHTVTSGRPRAGSMIYAKRRAISTPLPSTSNRERSSIQSPRRNERRNITDPNVFRRPPTASQSEYPMSFASEIRGPRRSVLPPRLPRDFRIDMGHLRDTTQRPLTSDAVTLSALQNGPYRQPEPAYSPPIRQRAKRHSIAASDPASTVIGSDDTRIFTSGDEDETDFLTDTAFDSIRTHFTTSSNTGLHPPRIETLFDRNPSTGPMNEGLVKLEDLVQHGSFASRSLDKGRISDSGLNSIRAPDHGHQGNTYGCEENIRLSLLSDLSDDDDGQSMVAALPSEANGQLTHLMRPILPLEAYQDEPDTFFSHHIFDSPNDSNKLADGYDSRSLTKEALDTCPKMNIFDWSEQPRSDREVPGSDSRPRTVHGKHGPETRISRAPGRKAPSALHLRSQSVPVSRDPSLPSESRQTSGKFGTWGLGSKGVSEDWDSDFEFDDGDEGTFSEDLKPNNNISEHHGMMVPQAILERQASLRGQFGQVQELTLLVAEMKRLRHQASLLDVVHGPSSELWKEAEGIVDLATLDDDNNESPPRSPSSLTFSFDDSEGESSNTNDPSKRISGESWRASLSDRSNSGRPNQNSTKAKSVLDLIYQQRVSNESTLIEPHVSRTQKLPFDTQSLRDLVIRAGVITRALKEVIRKAEGVATTPEQEILPSDPPFIAIRG